MHFLSLHKPIIGMIHLPALPGTPRHQLSPQALVDQVLAEAETYQEAGIDALMIENMHDRPYLNQTVGPEIVAMVTRIASELRRVADCPCGLQILAGANQEALAVAHATGLDFIRAEGFVFGHVADEGYIDAQAGALLRYRKQIGAEQVKILTDIKKKHSSHALTADVSLAETAEAAAFFLSDGLVITGSSHRQSCRPGRNSASEATGEASRPGRLRGDPGKCDRLPGPRRWPDHWLLFQAKRPLEPGSRFQPHPQPDGAGEGRRDLI
jgi:membrane complex biogenesis BtpA family protein